MGMRAKVIKTLVFNCLLFLIQAVCLYSNTDNQNAIYLAWESCPGELVANPADNVGQIQIFALVDGTTLTIYESNTPGSIIDDATAFTNYSLLYEGQPIDWVSVAGTAFTRKYFKMTSNFPIIWESSNPTLNFSMDAELALISNNGNYRGNKFYTYMQYMTDKNDNAHGHVLTIFNPENKIKTVTVGRWNGVNLYNVSPATFTVPADSVYVYGGTNSSAAGYYSVTCSDGDIMVMKGLAETSDNDNWLEYGFDWNSGKKIGNLVYGKFGRLTDRIIITGISGLSNYTLYTLSYPAFMTSGNSWSSYTSGSVSVGSSVKLNPPLAGLFKVVVTGGEVLVSGGTSIMSGFWGDGDCVPGVNNHTPSDTEFYFATGNAWAGAGDPSCSVICPLSGTAVTLSPSTGTTVQGLNPTTAEDMAINWSHLKQNTTYHVTSNQPVLCFLQSRCGTEKAMALSYLSIVTPTATKTFTFTPSITDTPTMTPTFTVTSTSTVTLTVTPTFTVTLTSSYTFTQTLTVTKTVTPTTTPTPKTLVLTSAGNYPNPFADGTNIVFWLSRDADIEVKIFTISGELVLLDPDVKGDPGYNTFLWDGRNKNGKTGASGVFIYKVSASTERNEKQHFFSKCARVK